MKIESTVFSDGGEIPSTYTCDGQNVNPPLVFKDIPPEAQSLALIMHDPDAPSGDFLHWTIWNIDPEYGGIDQDSVPDGAVQGTTDFGSEGYGGPCPPSGTHSYIFELYALSSKLDLESGARRQEIEDAVGQNLIEVAKLTGSYARSV